MHLRCFVAIYALLREEKISQNYVCGEKMTNIRYGYQWIPTDVVDGRTNCLNDSKIGIGDDESLSTLPIDNVNGGE